MAERARSAQACDPCRRRKVRCNGQPNCQQCTHVGLVCTYPVLTQGVSRKMLPNVAKSLPTVANSIDRPHTLRYPFRGRSIPV
ncbi:hypothetical protein V1506DRAFT_547509 [Lipomyces tetrasporus]